MIPDAPGPTAVLVLTCRNSAPRRVLQARQRANGFFSGCDVRFVDGPIGQDAIVDAVFDPAKARLLTKTAPTRTEIACYVSHRLAWQALLDGPHDQAIIVEDDFAITDPRLLRQVLDNAQDLMAGGRHIIKLFDYPRDRSRNLGIAIRVAGIDLVKWQRTRAGLVGYMISREGARRFLARDRVFRVVDEDLKYYWELGLDIWSVLPSNPISEDDQAVGGSLLEAHRQQAKKRSLFRSLKGLVLNIRRDLLNRRAFALAQRATGLPSPQLIGKDRIRKPG